MSKAKRALAFMAAVLMCGLAGCGGSSDSSGDKSDAATNKGGKIVFWNVSYKTVDDNGVYATEDLMINKTMKEFEEKNNCKVEIVNQTYDNIPNLFKTAGVAKNGPDVAFLWAGSFTNDYQDFIEPLDSYFTEEELAGFPNLDLCRAGFKSDGALLAIPTDVTTLNLFYNKDAFEKAGLPRDAKFETMEELEEACEKLSAAGITPFAMADGGGYVSAWGVGSFLATIYGPQDIFKLLPGQSDLTGPEFTEAMTRWADFTKKVVDNNWANGDAFTTTADDPYMSIYTGDTAMRFGGSWDCSTLYTELGDSVGTMPVPNSDPSDPYSGNIVSQIGNNLVVTNYSKNKQLAVDFVKACTTKENYLLRYEQEGQLPGRIDMDLSQAKESNPMLEACYEWFAQDNNVIGFDSVISADAAAEFYRQAPLMATGDVSVEEAVALIQEKNVATSGDAAE